MIALIVLKWSWGGLGLGGWGVQKIRKTFKTFEINGYKLQAL